MKVYIFDTKEALFETLSQSFIKEIKNKPNINLGLATGGTPVPLYEKLIEDHKLNGTTYKNVNTYNLDEYIGIEETHSQSYRTFMNETFFNHIDINKKNTHVPKGNVSNVEEETKRYDKLLDENPIDLQLLGIGSNAHIAFNEPGSNFDSGTIVVDLTKETLEDNARFFDNIKDVPTKSITMGIGSILKAKKIVLVATGANKAEAVKNTVLGIISKNVPASVLQTHPHVELYIDADAAKLIR